MRVAAVRYHGSVVAPAFEYDVFISFASKDQELVRPLSNGLRMEGLRVFWSDSELLDRAGASWLEIIQESLERSRHFLLVCTPLSLASTWVKREYVAFLGHCYRPPDRLLVPVLGMDTQFDDLPIFLRGLEGCRLDDLNIAARLAKRFTSATTLPSQDDSATKVPEVQASTETVSVSPATYESAPPTAEQSERVSSMIADAMTVQSFTAPPEIPLPVAHATPGLRVPPKRAKRPTPQPAPAPKQERYLSPEPTLGEILVAMARLLPGVAVMTLLMAFLLWLARF